MGRAPEYQRLYWSQRWKMTSRYVRAVARGQCQVSPGCPNPVTETHHLIPASTLNDLGLLHLFFDVRLLRASCRACNSGHAGRLTGERQRERRLAQAIEDYPELGAMFPGLAGESESRWPAPPPQPPPRPRPAPRQAVRRSPMPRIF